MTPTELIGKEVRFIHQAKALRGVVIAAEPNGFTAKGNIPDLTLTVRGASGKTLKISQVGSHAQWD